MERGAMQTAAFFVSNYRRIIEELAGGLDVRVAVFRTKSLAEDFRIDCDFSICQQILNMIFKECVENSAGKSILVEFGQSIGMLYVKILDSCNSYPGCLDRVSKMISEADGNIEINYNHRFGNIIELYIPLRIADK
jgi:hypothetical protein